MATSEQPIEGNKHKGTLWAGTNITSPTAEGLLTYNSLPLIFKVPVYGDISMVFVNKHATEDTTLKVFVSNAADPGSTYATHFGADSAWVQAQDEAGVVITIVVTADGTPANNEIRRLLGIYEWLAIAGSNGSGGDLASVMDIYVKFIPR